MTYDVQAEARKLARMVDGYFDLEDSEFADNLSADIEAALLSARTSAREECAKVAEHLNGWGCPPAPKLANHIAACIRALGGK